MKKKLLSLFCLLAAVVLAGCGAAPTTLPQETAVPDSSETADTAAEEAQTAQGPTDVWREKPTYNFDEMKPLYSEWTHTAGQGEAEGLYAVRSGDRWSLFSSKTGSVFLVDESRQMPYLYDTHELSVWVDEAYYNDFQAMKDKCRALDAQLMANGTDFTVPAGEMCVFDNGWIYTEDGQIYYDLRGNFVFNGTPLEQMSDVPALFGVQQAYWDEAYQGYCVENDALYAVADSTGTLLTDFQYKNVCMVGDKLIAVQNTDGNWGYCDKSGREVIPCIYQGTLHAKGGLHGFFDYPFPDRSGVVIVQGADGTKSALYTDGTTCIAAGRFEDMTPAPDGCVWAKQNGLWGLLEVN